MKMYKNQTLPISFSVDKDFKSDKFIKLRMRICHDGVNPNGSRFAIENLTEKKNTLANSPILADVYFDEDNVPQFGGHDMEIQDDKVNPGSARMIYIEKPVGVIPETNNFEVVKEGNVNYIYADGYIWKGYSNYCPDVIERYEDVKISMEVDVLSYSYNKEENIFDINDFVYRGVTLLNENMGTGMKNALATVEEFSQNTDSKPDMAVIIKELNFALEQYNDNSQKGEKIMNTELTNSILKEYEITAEELDFEITDEMTEADFRAALDDFACKKKKKCSNEEPAKPEDVPEDSGEDEPNTDEPKDEEEDKKDFSTEGTQTEEVATQFATANQKRDSLRRALPDVCHKNENGECIESIEYYINDFDDKFVYVERYHWIKDSNDDEFKIGRYGYTYDESTMTATITGEFAEMVRVWLTPEENANVQKSRTQFSEMKAELDELKSFKEKVISDERNAQISAIFAEFDVDLADVEGYAALKENFSEMSIDDISTKCYALLGMKNKKSQKPTKESKTTVQFNIGHDTEHTAWYEELFDMYGKR